MGDTRFERYLKAFEEEPPVSIRLNPLKTEGMTVCDGERVPWCRHAYYLKQRPQFTFDPMLHAGCYYVQEAASMFLDQVLRQWLPQHPVAMLDMCAAPGGKSTLARTALPQGSTLYANEPMRQRANILMENMQKWGYGQCIVTNCYPKDYRKNKMMFDVILCDVPCSGEGMFRKDEATIKEWSPQQVDKCQRLQREIVNEAWECLKDGGLLVYSTCTLNTKENEENVRWLLAEHEAEALTVETKPEWNITGSLLEGFTAPVYRFIPGITRGEGLFMAAIRKQGCSQSHASRTMAPLLYDGTPKPTAKGRDMIPSQAMALSTACNLSAYPTAELNYAEAVSYLRGEALALPSGVPQGFTLVTFNGKPLGFVKNIGTRANNLYPKEWKIKTTHIPDNYETILRTAEQDSD